MKSSAAGATKQIAVLCCAALLLACRSEPSAVEPNRETAVMVAHYQQCGYAKTTLEPIDSQQQWAAWLRYRGETRDAPAWRQADQQRWIVAAGFKPTAGYQLNFSPAAEADSVQITVSRAGGIDAVYAQVISSPCVVIDLLQGRFSLLVVTQPDGSQRRFRLTEP